MKQDLPINALVKQTKHFLGEHYEAFVLVGISHGEQELIACSLCPKNIQAIALNQSMVGIMARGGIVSDVNMKRIRESGELPNETTGQ